MSDEADAVGSGALIIRSGELCPVESGGAVDPGILIGERVMAVIDARVVPESRLIEDEEEGPLDDAAAVRTVEVGVGGPSGDGSSSRPPGFPLSCAITGVTLTGN